MFTPDLIVVKVIRYQYFCFCFLLIGNSFVITGKFVGLPPQWASLIQGANASNRPRPIIDPSNITHTEIMDMKAHTIVRGSSVAIMNSNHVPRKADVTRSNSLRKADSPPSLRPNRMPPPLPENDIVDGPTGGPAMQYLQNNNQQQINHQGHPYHPHQQQNVQQFRGQPTPFQQTIQHQANVNMNQQFQQVNNSNIKNGFNGTNSVVNNNINNNNVWHSKISMLPHPQQPILPHNFQMQQPNQVPFQQLHYQQQMQQQLQHQQQLQQQQQQQQMQQQQQFQQQLQHQQHIQQQIQQQQQQQLHIQNMQAQQRSKSPISKPLSMPYQNQTNSFQNEQSSVGHLQQQMNSVPSQNQLPQKPQFQQNNSQLPHPRMNQQLISHQQQQQQRLLTHEQFRAALQEVVSPGDPR